MDRGIPLQILRLALLAQNDTGGGSLGMTRKRSLRMTPEGFTRNDTRGGSLGMTTMGGGSNLPEHHRESKHYRYGIAGVLAWGPFWGGGDCSYYFVVEVWVDASDYLYVGH